MPTPVGITSLTVTPSAPLAICAKEDGSVHIYDISSEPRSQELFVQPAGLRISHLHFEAGSGILSSVDIVNRVVSRELVRKRSVGSRWEVRNPLITVQPEAAVVSILTSGKHSRLLISTSKSDILYRLPGNSNGQCLVQIENSEERHWVQSESHADQLVLMTKEKIQIRVWDTLECLASVSLSSGFAAPFTTVDRLIPLDYSPFFATVAIDPSGSTSQSTTQIWDLRTITSDHSHYSSPTETYNFGALSPTIEAVIGVINGRIIFLNTSYWVCSLDLENPLAPEGVVQHFFIPSDSVSSLKESGAYLGKNGDIIFVRRAELAVIKKGLEVTVNGTYTLARRRSFGTRRGFSVVQRTIQR